MISLFEEAAKLQEMLQAEGLEFFFVGGVALQIWGQPRLTTDIDLAVFTELRNEDERIEWFLAHYKPLIGDNQTTLEFARQRRVLLLKSETNTEIDVMLEGLADISEEVRRASFEQFTPTISLRVCSPDTLVAMKTVAGRAQDIADLESVIIKQRALDWAYVDRYLEQIMEYEDISSKIDSLQNIKRKYYRP